jgi:hypothetical protein
VIYANAQSLLSKINELEAIAADTKPDLIFICETWCNTDINNASLNICGYKFQTELRMDRADTTYGMGGGLVVYAKDGLEILKCDNVLPFNQYCKLKIDACGEEFYFYVIYRPLSGRYVSKTMLGDLIKNAEKKCTMIGDFNLPDIDWATGAAKGGGLKWHC